MMVAPGENARPRRRAERGGMHVCVEKAILRKLVDVGRIDRRAKATKLTVASVIEHNEQYVRRSWLGADGRRPCRRRLADGASHAAGKCCSRRVFLQFSFCRRTSQRRGCNKRASAQ